MPVIWHGKAFPTNADHSCPLYLSTVTLELKAEKRNAHWSKDNKSIKDGLKAVKFSPDGTKIISCGAEAVKVWDVETLAEIDERRDDVAKIDKSGEVAERDSATLRLKEGGGAFYASSPLQCVAVHWPKLVAGAESGELYHLEVEG